MRMDGSEPALVVFLFSDRGLNQWNRHDWRERGKVVRTVVF